MCGAWQQQRGAGGVRRLSVCVVALLVAGPSPAASRQLMVDAAAGTVSFPAVLQAEAFASSTPPDHRYHAVVFDEGDAVGKALFRTPASDVEIARVLREFGADDAGGLPMAAWTLRRVPLVPHPSSHVLGSRTDVTVRWEGSDRAYPLHELLEDSGGQGIHIHFGGNERHDDHWPSGCIICLFSCPGGVLSNGAYSIRDHVRQRTDFVPGDLLPPDGTPVTITLNLVPG